MPPSEHAGPASLATRSGEPPESFEPVYGLDQEVHRRHGLIERADHELGFLAVMPALRSAMAAEALAENTQAAVRLEGGSLDLPATRRLLASDPSEDLPLPERQVVRHAAILRALPRRAVPKNVEDVFILHEELFQGILPDAGETKREPAPLRLGDPPREVTLTTTPPEHVDAALYHLLSWLTAAPEHPLVRVEVFHHAFLHVHPFRKGNHQVAHTLTTLYLQEFGYPGVAYVPWSFAMLSAGTTRDAAFVDAVTEGGDLTPWIRFLSGTLHEAFGSAAQRVLFRRELPRDLGPRAVRVADVVARWDLLMGGMWFRVGDLAGDVEDIPRRTLQRELNALCKAGVLEAHGTGSATKYGIRGSVDMVEVGMAMLKATGGKP